MADFNLAPVIVGPEPAPAPSQLDQFRAKLLGASQGFADQHPDAYRAMRAGGPIGSGLEAMGVIPPVANPEALRAASFAQGAAMPMPEGERAIAFGTGAGPAPAQSTTLTPSVSLLGAPPKLQMPGQGGGGYGGGPSPMSRLAGAVQQDNRDLLGTYDTQKGQTLERGDMEAKQLTDVANIQQAMAQRQQQLAHDRAQEAADAESRFNDWTKQSAAKVEQLAEMKVDPSRLFSKMGNGEKMMMMIGGALGGVLQGAGLTQQNEFVKSVRERVQDDIQAQQGEIEGKNREVAQRNTLLGQFMGIHGDKRLATMQAENQLLDGTRQYLLAQADKDNLPPQARQNALMAAGLLNREQVQLRKGIDSAALQAAQQQAAAAASAQAAAQKQAWDRSMQVAEMGLKRDQLMVEAGKATGARAKELDGQVAELSKRLGDEKLVKDRQLIDDMHRRLLGPDGKVDTTKGFPGVGPLADARNTIAPAFAESNLVQKAASFIPTTAIPMAILRGTAGLSSEERVSRQDWENAKLAYRNLRTGSGGSAKELQEIGQAFEGTASPQEQANTITKLRDYYIRQESTAKAGYDPEAVRTFENRMAGGANAPMPSSVQIKPSAGMLSDERTKKTVSLDAYDTRLSDADEAAFRAWKQQFAPRDSGGDYDLRGAFKSGARPGENGHWTDEFKKPNHPTFSDESRYATGHDAARAGHWDGDQFISPQMMAEASAWANQESARVAQQSKNDMMAPTAVRPRQMEEYLQATRPAAYEYTTQAQGSAPGPQVGPASAQQMARTAIGATMVAPGQDGLLRIDPQAATKATMGAVSYVNDKANAVDARLQEFAKRLGVKR